MVFSSFEFLFRFLPFFLLIYYVTPQKWKNAVLFAGSILFYTAGEAEYVVLLLASVVINYVFGRLMYRDTYEGRGKKQLILLIVALCYDFGVLFLFKYSGFMDKLPLGISFYTFQIAAYIIDVYRGRVPVEKSFIRLGTYVTMFPQLIAGPIINYSEVRMALCSRTVTFEQFESGLKTLILGLGAKVIVADRIGLLWNNIQAIGFESISTPLAWMGAFAYSIELYFDFSGYSLMALGLGRMLGFEFPKNFKHPYISRSVSEFWRRWHITLGRWFREYVYIPLGGNRKGKVRTCINKFIVFLCTGIWHGANVTFLFWGIYHGCFLMLEEFVPFFRKEGGKIKTAVMRIYTLLVVCIGFVFFRADTMTQGVQWVKAMFTGFSTGAASTSLALQQLTPLYLVTFIVACIASFPVFEKWKSDGRYQAFYNNMAFVCSIVGLVLCMLSLAGGTYNPFIYFRF